jgi:predicted P-loop ATPase
MPYFPPEMVAAERWIVDYANGPKAKSPRRSRRADSRAWTQSKNWLLFDEAKEIIDRDGGLFGFVLGGGIQGIDLDDCLDDDLHVVPSKKELVDHVLDCCPGFVEVTHSRHGLHVYVRGSVKKAVTHVDGLEMYADDTRQFCMTGIPWREPPTVLPECQAGLDELSKTVDSIDEVKPENAPITKGQRRNTIFKKAQALFKAGLNEDAVIAAMFELNKTFKTPLDDDQVISQCEKRYPDQVPPPWADQLVWDAKHTAPKNMLSNISVAIKSHEELQDLFWYDVRSLQIMLTREPPWRDIFPIKQDVLRFEDTDLLAISHWLGVGSPSIIATPSQVLDVVNAIAKGNSRDPFVDYLDGLVWDGEPYLDRFMEGFCHCEENPLNEVFFKKWLVSAVARTYLPQSKVDTMLVLVGNQGFGKSKFLQELVPEPRYFATSIPKQNDKDALLMLRGPVIIEDGEMTLYGARDIARIKEFITCESDRIREPYGRVTKEFPRKCVFAGSTNDDECLRDVTGGRRFWPIFINQRIEFDLVPLIRDQLWAHAVYLYKQGEQWWLSPEEETLSGARQEEYREVDALEEKISEVLSEIEKPNAIFTETQWKEGKLVRISSLQVYDLLAPVLSAYEHFSYRRIGWALKKLGWKKTGRSRENEKRVTWYRKEKEK